MWTDYWVIGRCPSIKTCRDSHCSRKVDPLGWSWHPLPLNVKIRKKNRSTPGNAFSSYQDPHFLSAPDSGKPLMADQNLLQLYSNVICLIHFDNAYTFNISVSSFKAVPSIAKYFNSKSKCFFFKLHNFVYTCMLYFQDVWSLWMNILIYL